MRGELVAGVEEFGVVVFGPVEGAVEVAGEDEGGLVFEGVCEDGAPCFSEMEVSLLVVGCFLVGVCADGFEEGEGAWLGGGGDVYGESAEGAGKDGQDALRLFVEASVGVVEGGGEGDVHARASAKLRMVIRTFWCGVKMAEPATMFVAPAWTISATLLGLMPPSTWMATWVRPRSSWRRRRRAILWVMVGMYV